MAFKKQSDGVEVSDKLRSQSGYYFMDAKLAAGVGTNEIKAPPGYKIVDIHAQVFGKGALCRVKLVKEESMRYSQSYLALGLCVEGDSTVFLSRKDHDKTMPWSMAAKALVKKAKRKDSLAGFQYTFPDEKTADDFRVAIGLDLDEDTEPVNGPGAGCQNYDDGRDAGMDGIKESFHDWAVRWREFDRSGRLSTKERSFSTEKARDAFIDKLTDQDNFSEIVATSDPHVSESTQRYCLIYKAKDGKWYMDLADREYGEREDATTYGPFSSEDAADRELTRNHSNPGGWNTDDSGKAPAPKKSPNGRPVRAPR